jgi:hypothetical protein
MATTLPRALRTGSPTERTQSRRPVCVTSSASMSNASPSSMHASTTRSALGSEAGANIANSSCMDGSASGAMSRMAAASCDSVTRWVTRSAR